MLCDGSRQWAEEHFGAADLGDLRRTKRLVAVAAMMADQPACSLPKQLVKWADLKAAYRLFDGDQVTFEAVAQPHYERRHRCGPRRCLIVSDTTELNFTWKRQIPDLGFLGKGQGYGFLLHSALMLAEDGQVMGLAGQKLMCRQRKKKKTRTQALQQPRESQLWTQVIDAVGPPPPESQWIHVADRGADNFEVYHQCCRQHCDWVIRARCLKRQLLFPDDESHALQAELPRLRVVGEYSLPVRSREKRARDVARPAHTALLQVSIGTCRMPPPRLRSADLKSQDLVPIPMQIVHVREIDPPDPKAAINWVLYTSLPVATFADAQSIIEAYQKRWSIEEWHKCLKTGCRVTKRQLQSRERLEPLIALLSIQAVRLLGLKHLARHAPDTPARNCVPERHLDVLSRRTNRPAKDWTIHEFIREVAGLGGFLKRKHDGQPGWQTIWHGWQYLMKLSEGYQLANPP